MAGGFRWRRVVARCAQCGAESPEGARFCVLCGQAVAQEEAPSTSAPSGPPPSQEDLTRADRILTEAFACSDQGRLTEAVRLAQQALSFNPNSTTAHSLLGTLYERLGNRDAAIREYQAVLALSPGSTADRQRLNELLGMPAAPAPAPPAALPKAARRPDLFYIAGFSLLAIILIAMTLVLLHQTGKSSPEEKTARLTTPGPATPRSRAQKAESLSIPSELLPLPGVPAGPYLAPQEGAPSEEETEEGPPTASSEPAMEDSGGSAVSYEPEPEEGLRPPLVLPFRGYTPPTEPPTRFLPGGGVVLYSPPTVTTPPPVAAAGPATRAFQPNIRTARQLVVSGRLEEARDVYESTLASRSSASPKLRQELATVYFRLNQPAKAATQYLSAYRAYQAELRHGVEGVEAQEAEHGLATCRAGLRALGVEAH